MNKKDEFIKALKFALLGLTTTAVESLAYTVLLFFSASQMPAQAISYALGAVNSYAVNRKFTFKTNEKFLSTELLKFFVVNLISLLFGLLAMFILTRFLKIEGTVLKDAAAKIIAMFMTTISNYLGNRLWVFK